MGYGIPEAERPAASEPRIESVRSPRTRAITNTVTALSRDGSGGGPLNGD
jgi:hypothetical protein